MKLNYLQNMLGFPMNPKKRALRKNVHKFYGTSIKKAANDSQRKLWVAAALAAEELVAALLALEDKSKVELFKQRILRKRIDNNQIRAVLLAYLSTILVSVTNYKHDVLAKTEMNEEGFLKSWCAVFEYKQEDMQFFDEILTPAYQRNGFNGLLQETGKIVIEHFYQDASELTRDEVKQFEDIFTKDVIGIFNYLNQ